MSPHEVEEVVRSYLKRRLHGKSLPFLESHGGYALENGGRAYWDRLGNISAAEYSTPETRDPLSACAYVLAGHRFYRALADEIEADTGANVEVHLPGTCVTTGRANGAHLNYYRHVDEPAFVLAPHLVSLPSICGCGGWVVKPSPSLEFVRSPRAELITQFAGSDSSRDRPLIDTYRKHYCQSGRRVQELSADATHSMPQLYVRLGTTALLLAMYDCWDVELDILALTNPVATLKTWNRDPTSKITVPGHGRCNAFDLQRRLIDLVRDKFAHPQGALPSWSRDVVDLWERFVDAATNEDSDDRVALDWAVHESLLQHACTQQGFAWSKLKSVAASFARRGQIRQNRQENLDIDTLSDGLADTHQLDFAHAELQIAGLSWDQFEWAIRNLQPLLHLVSTEFREFGGGLSDCFGLQAREYLPLLTNDRVQQAATDPPQDTRAKVVQPLFVIMRSSQEHPPVGMFWNTPMGG